MRLTLLITILCVSNICHSKELVIVKGYPKGCEIIKYTEGHSPVSFKDAIDNLYDKALKLGANTIRFDRIDYDPIDDAQSDKVLGYSISI